MATTPNPTFWNVRGTSEGHFRIGVSGPTIYQGSGDPNSSPPTAIPDGIKDGDMFIRLDSPSIWLFDSGSWSALPTSSGGSVFAGDVIMDAGAQFFGDDGAGAAAPAISFGNTGTQDDDTGLFWPGADTIGFATGGSHRLNIEADGTLSVQTANYELLVTGDDDIPNKKFVDDNFVNLSGDTMTGDLTLGAGTQLFLPDGTLADPAIAFTNDTDSGIFRTADPGFGLGVGGAEKARIIGTAIQFSVPLRTGTGTATAPVYSATSDTNTGIFFGGTDDLRITTGGTLRTTFGAATMTSTLRWLGPDGSATTPAISFSGAAGMGMFRDVANLKFATASTERLGIDSSGRISALTASYETLVDADGVLTNKKYVDDQDDLRVAVSGDTMTGDLIMDPGAQVQIDDATAADPGLAFTGDTTTGIYRETGGVGITVGGTLNAAFLASTFDVKNPITETDGTAAAPAYSFLGDTDTGIFRETAPLGVAIAVGSAKVANFTATALINQDGTAALPSYAFAVATDTGLFRQTSTLGVAISVSGTEIINVTASGIQGADDAALNLLGGTATAGAGNDVAITASDSFATSAAVGGDVVLTGGAGDGSAIGGGVTVTAGTGGDTASGGNISITGGAGGATSGAGGTITLTGGAPTTTGAGGGISIITGSGVTNGAGGTLTITTGNAGGSSGQPGGDMDITLGDGGSSTGLGGAFNLTAGQGGTTANGGDISLTGGDGGTSSGDGGDIILTAGGQTAGDNGSIVHRTGGSTPLEIEAIHGATDQTTDDTTTTIFTLPVAAGDTIMFEAYVVAREDATGASRADRIFGAIGNLGGTTAIVGTNETASVNDAGAASWTAVVVANDTNDELEVQVTGEAAKTIDWKCKLKATTV